MCIHSLVCRYCEVHRGPERVQVLEVNVPLVEIKIRTSAYLVFIYKSIAVTCVEDSIEPEYLGTWVSYVTQHGNIGLGNNLTNRSLSYFVPRSVPKRVTSKGNPFGEHACPLLVRIQCGILTYSGILEILLIDIRSITEPFGFQSGCPQKSSDMLVVSSETSFDLVNTGYSCLEAKSVNR